eukprot:scaffold571120_cov37-Prasinocladus_malaysianus.AAC.1
MGASRRPVDAAFRCLSPSRCAQTDKLIFTANKLAEQRIPVQKHFMRQGLSPRPEVTTYVHAGITLALNHYGKEMQPSLSFNGFNERRRARRH